MAKNPPGVGIFKFLTAFINLLFFLSGIGLLVIGGYGLADELSSLTSTGIAAFILAIGVLVTVVSGLGCLGALKLHRGMLKAYAVLVFIFVVCEITAGSLAYVYRDEIPGAVQESWYHLYDEGDCGAMGSAGGDTCDTLIDLQNYYDCCGFLDVNDRAVPSTCAVDMSRTVSCQASIEQTVEDNFKIVAIASIVIGSLQLICFVIACCLICRIPTKEEQEQALLDEARRLNRETYSATSGNPPINYTTTTVYHNV